jgi:hypothetical protein
MLRLAGSATDAVNKYDRHTNLSTRGGPCTYIHLHYSGDFPSTEYRVS